LVLSRLEGRRKERTFSLGKDERKALYHLNKFEDPAKGKGKRLLKGGVL